jgi:hypothetical protein
MRYQRGDARSKATYDVATGPLAAYRINPAQSLETIPRPEPIFALQELSRDSRLRQNDVRLTFLHFLRNPKD